MPGLLEARKWDSVRAILITPPLSDCWGKNARPLLREYASAVGDGGGDELAALEAREDAMSHLRHPPCGHQIRVAYAPSTCRCPRNCVWSMARRAARMTLASSAPARTAG